MPAAGPQNTRRKQIKRKKPTGQYTPGSPTPVSYPQAQPKRKPKIKVRPANTAQTYVSQGRAVKKAATQQRRVARIRRRTMAVSGDKPMTAQERATNDQQVAKVKRSLPVKYVDFEKGRKKAAQQRLVQLAPVLRVLDQTTRPLHGVAAGTNAALKGQNVPKAVVRGVQNKDRTTFSDVLKTAGVHNKTIRGVAGFVGDVALDPTTYVTGGTASVARGAAEKAARDASAKALAKGLTKEQADRFGQRAAARALKTAPDTKGATVKFAGHKVPGVTKATATAAKPVKAAARKVTPSRGKDVVADVNPNAVPRGATRATSDAAVNATRTARGKINTGERDAVALAHGIRSKVGEQNYNAIVDAIEAGKINRLPADLAGHAHTLRSQFKGIRRIQRRAGVKVADVTQSKTGGVKGYVYRQLTDEAAQADAKKLGARSGGIKPASSKVRKEKRPLAVVRQQQPGRYREDLHALAAERLAHGHTSAAKAQLNHDLAALGRDVKRGKPLNLQEGEAVFHVKGHAISEVTDKKLLDRITHPLTLNKKGTKVKYATPKGVGGRFVILNREIVARSTEGSAPTLKGPGILHAFDKTTSGFKRIALATPGFHIRNLVGDTAQAYVGQPGRKLPRNLSRAKKTTRALAESDKAKRALEPRPVNPKGHGVKTTQYGHVRYEDLAAMLVKHGAARSGYTARELRELSQSGGVKQGGKIRQTLRKGRKAAGDSATGQAAKRATLTREDLPRIATAIHALQNGATWEQAARKVADTHFDYAHLTSFERNVARRILPFYTWSARNIPFTTKNLVARPGKYANFQKVREEATKASGVDQQPKSTRDLYRQLQVAGVKLPKGWARYLTEWEQRNAGVPISIGGKKFTESMGLPLQDLNEFPGAAGAGQLGEYYQKGMSLVNPVIKDPVEYFENHSFFFRDQLQRDHSPLVAAPSYVTGLSAGARKRLGIAKIQDKKSGKMVWGWPGKLDYIAKSVPGAPNYGQQFATSGADRRGKGEVGKALAFAGLKSVPIDPVKNAVNLAYARQQEIQNELAGLRQQGVGKDHPTPRWRKLNDQLKIVNQIAYQGKVSQGYKVLPTSGAPTKIRTGVKWGTGGGSVKWSDQQSGVKWSG